MAPARLSVCRILPEQDLGPAILGPAANSLNLGPPSSLSKSVYKCCHVVVLSFFGFPLKLHANRLSAFLNLNLKRVREMLRSDA